MEIGLVRIPLLVYCTGCVYGKGTRCPLPHYPYSVGRPPHYHCTVQGVCVCVRVCVRVCGGDLESSSPPSPLNKKTCLVVYVREGV